VTRAAVGTGSRQGCTPISTYCTTKVNPTGPNCP
jgi:hypothetical protein